VWFLQEAHGVTSKKTPFFIVTAVKTSNLTFLSPFIGLQYQPWMMDVDNFEAVDAMNYRKRKLKY
jgi:hypothetical protein